MPCVEKEFYMHTRGASALLVSTFRAMREPLLSGTSDKDLLHAFFTKKHYHLGAGEHNCSLL